MSATNWRAAEISRLRPALARAAMIGLLALGFARLAQVALHTPLLGYANNYDFIKISSTVGLWVDEPEVGRYENHPSAPFRHYRSHGPRHSDMRYLSSELIFVYLAIASADALNFVTGPASGSLDLRVLGLVKTLLFVASGVFLSVLFSRRSAALGVLSAFIFVIVLADPMNSLYFNTLYFDDSAVFFGYLAMGVGLYLTMTDRPSTPLTVFFCTVLVLLGLSKVQHAGLPLAVALAFCVGRARLDWVKGCRRRLVSSCVPVLCAAVLALWLGVVNNRSPSMRSMVHAAATNSWFGTMLPALSDPTASLRSLGVSERCAAFVGKIWYSEGMQPPPCPEIFRLNRLQMVHLLLTEPPALWRILKNAIPATRPFIVFYGQVEGRHFGRFADEGARFASIGKFVGELPSVAYVTLFLGSLVGGLLSLSLLIRGQHQPGLTLSLFLSAALLATFLACLLGDGYDDLSRHFHIAQSILLIAPVVTVWRMVSVASSGLARTRWIETQ